MTVLTAGALAQDGADLTLVRLAKATGGDDFQCQTSDAFELVVMCLRDFHGAPTPGERLGRSEQYPRRMRSAASARCRVAGVLSAIVASRAKTCLAYVAPDSPGLDGGFPRYCRPGGSDSPSPGNRGGVAMIDLHSPQTMLARA
jgi:hypothetical protein